MPMSRNLELVRLSPALGVEIRGLDLSKPLDSSQAAQIREAWQENLVVLIRGQYLTDAQLVDFAKIFGPLEQAPPNKAGKPWIDGFPQLACISNIAVDGKPIGSLGSGEAEWHTDMSYIDAPPTASLLYSLEVPPDGGGTHFMNMYAAYETLPDALKDRIRDKRAVHDATYSSAGEVRKIYAEFDGNTDPDRAPGARHPLVVRHPESGRPALFLGRRSGASGIVGEPDGTLFKALWNHCLSGDFSWRHDWRVGDLLIWDNRCCMHYRESFDNSARRMMHRAQIKGTVPVAAFGA
jgi:taurine dioxygenase